MPPRSIAQVVPVFRALSLAELPPAFLAPALHRSFSSSTPQCGRKSPTSRPKKHDRNPLRGVSAIHRTGPREPSRWHDLPVPKSPEFPPASSPANLKHGLWGFFYSKDSSLITPQDEFAHGRSWALQELRGKSWEDLHRLWWVCVRERNRIATQKLERYRLRAGYGDYESENRDNTIRATQHAIKHVLRERWYAWEDARELYNQDESYRPSNPEENLEPVADLEDRMPVERTVEEARATEAATRSS